MVSDAELSVLKTMSKAVGVDMVLYQSEEQNGEYQGANGFYRNGTVYLDVHAGATKTTQQSAILLTAAHELTHYLRENNAEAYTELQDFVMQHLIESGTDIETLAKQKVAKERGLISMEDAAEEVIADSCEMMLENTQVPQMMAKENPGLFAQIREWLAEFTAKLRRAFEGVQARSAEAQAMMQYAEELQQMWDNALAGAAQNVRNNTQTEANNGTTAANNGTTAANNGTTAANNGTTSGKNSFRGYDKETGRGIYESNFPKGTPKAAKAERILQYIQNVWSKKPITLVVENEDGSTRKIQAQFDPTYSEERGAQTDAKKLMGGNRHGTAAEQRVTLDLADDYYSIASDAVYNYSKAETGKENAAHKGVKQWHYFVNDILFQEYGEKETTPYRVTINVKERSDGQYVYSFSAEKQNERPSTRQTLHADVTSTAESDEGNARSFNNSISRSEENDNTKFSQRERDEDLQKKYPKLNLNEDISELDGVPAVELTDGSVLPILDRDRYPTHVSFIEGNRIDVDDLRSGGWIGDGVYDPSFTSDTARYIERKQAGKRVAELRGVPFNQFEDDGKSSMRDNTTDDTAAERKGRQESYANLRAENAKLREQLDYWKGQTKRTKEKTVRKTDVDAYAKRLTEQLHNPKAREQVADELKRMGDYIVQTPGSELSYT